MFTIPKMFVRPAACLVYGAQEPLGHTRDLVPIGELGGEMEAPPFPRAGREDFPPSTLPRSARYSLGPASLNPSADGPPNSPTTILVKVDSLLGQHWTTCSPIIYSIYLLIFVLQDVAFGMVTHGAHCDNILRQQGKTQGEAARGQFDRMFLGALMTSLH